jgi:hypothetical protein
VRVEDVLATVVSEVPVVQVEVLRKLQARLLFAMELVEFARLVSTARRTEMEHTQKQPLDCSGAAMFTLDWTNLAELTRNRTAFTAEVRVSE